MIAVYVSPGVTVPYTPQADVEAGDVIDLGTFVGIAHADIPTGELGVLHIEGVFDVDKYAGEQIALGDPIYWDQDTETATKTVAYQDAVMGLCVAAAASGDAKVRVKLTPGAVIPAA